MNPWHVSASDVGLMIGSWSDDQGSLATQLTRALTDLIDSGALAAGVSMPPQRQLAAALKVSRGVVTEAYGRLGVSGHLVSQQGSGSRVSSSRARVHARSGGRLFSFTSAPGDVIDLSTGALPASSVATRLLAENRLSVPAHYLETDGYFAPGLPVLRTAIAEQLTRDGVVTSPDEILVTAGAQQAAWLALTAFAGSGDLALVEEPTYRGALEVLRGQGTHIRGVRRLASGVDVDQLGRSLGQRPVLAYLQTGIHNPTGRASSEETLAGVAEVANRDGLLVVDDRSMSDLALSDQGPGSLAGLVDPDLLVMVGSLSKLFWGGLRIGWLRASSGRIAALSEVRKAIGLGCSVPDQLLACRLVAQTVQARRERREMLRTALASTEAVLREHQPGWGWDPVDGGSGLWVDVGTDSAELAAQARARGVKLVPGRAFSAHDGQATMVRIPLWHPAEQLEEAMGRLPRTNP